MISVTESAVDKLEIERSELRSKSVGMLNDEIEDNHNDFSDIGQESEIRIASGHSCCPLSRLFTCCSTTILGSARLSRESLGF